MDRPTHSVARLTPAIVAALTALVHLSIVAAVSPPAALAETPATDEYVFQIPGVRQNPTDSAVQSATGADARPSGPRQGVVGELDPPSSQLDSAVSALGSIPGALLAGFCALIALALLGPFAHRVRAREAR